MKTSRIGSLRTGIITTGLIGIVALSNPNISCTPISISSEQREIILKQVENKPYTALFEGLQPFSGYRMKDIAESLERMGIPACATSGNENAHMEMIRKARSHNQKIRIAGFSMGEKVARNLAQKCADEGIPVNALILIDGPDLGDISGNVEKVIDIRGYSPRYVLRRQGRYTEENLRNKNTRIKRYDIPGSHLDIPANSRSIIISEILGDYSKGR